jgi:phosphomannomutase/phosphoglucomutase
MNAAIFRQYDIRGIFGTDLMLENTYDLTRAIAAYIFAQNPLHKTIIVGMDVRTHSPLLHQEVCRGLQDSGYNIVDLGVCTSPMVYFATWNVSCAGAVMITASHNPKEYNGFKVVVGTISLWGTEIQEIKKLYENRIKVSVQPMRGIYEQQDITEAYCNWLLKQFPTLHGIHLPVVLPEIVKVFGWSGVGLLYETPDGTFPHHPADPIHTENMQDLWHVISQQGYKIGIGFDGDGDRMDALDEYGNLIPGDRLLAIFARSIASKQKNISVVCDITVSDGLLSVLESCNAHGIIAPCGSGIIQSYMREHNALLGGELSCHFFFADRAECFDDGIYAALRLLEILVTTGKTLAQLDALFPIKICSPQYRVICSEDIKTKVVMYASAAFEKRQDAKMITVDGARVILPYGWGLVRASNTQPVVVFRFESDTRDNLCILKKEFADLLSAQIGVDLRTAFEISGKE